MKKEPTGNVPGFISIDQVESCTFGDLVHVEGVHLLLSGLALGFGGRVLHAPAEAAARQIIPAALSRMARRRQSPQCSSLLLYLLTTQFLVSLDTTCCMTCRSCQY